MKNVYCKCGRCVGEEGYSHTDASLKEIDGGKVYRRTYNENAYRNKSGTVEQIGNTSHYYCKDCYIADYSRNLISRSTEALKKLLKTATEEEAKCIRAELNCRGVYTKK